MVPTIFLYILGGYLALTLVAFMLSLVFRPAGFLARSLAAYACMIAGAGFGLVTAPLLRLAGCAGLSQWLTGRCFALLMKLATGVRFEVHDPKGVLASTRPAVFVGNHQTELDVLMLGSMFPRYCSITAKTSLRSWPVLGWWMALSGSIFIDRKNSRDAREAMRGAAAEITARRQSVYMFPEGTRSYAAEPALLPFKKGAFHLAVEAGVPVVPCVVANYSHVLSVQKLLFTSGRIPISVLDPIPTAGLTAADVDELVKQTRDIMLEELIALSAEAKGQSVSPRRTDGGAVAAAVATGVDTAASWLPQGSR